MTLVDRKIRKLATLAESTILSRGLTQFRLEQLMGMLSIKRSSASKVVTMLKKSGFLHANDDNWDTDVCFRGWRIFVLRSAPRTNAMELQHERRGRSHKRHAKTSFVLPARRRLSATRRIDDVG